MCSLYSSVEQNETIYMVAHFFSHIVKLAGRSLHFGFQFVTFCFEGWDNSRGLDVLSRFASTIPLDVELSLSFVFIEPYAHLFVRDNPVEMPLFGSWIVARMAQTRTYNQKYTVILILFFSTRSRRLEKIEPRCD
jgi:hypothetical protein